MSENFPNLKRKNIQLQEERRVPNKINTNRSTPRYTTIKMVKMKDKEDSKVSKRKRVSYKEPQEGYQLISLQRLCRSKGDV